VIGRIEIDEKFLELFGTGTLLGTLLDLYGKAPEKVVLVFPRTTTAWREKFGGPHQYIVNEYTIACLLEDVLRLRAQGIEVSIEYETKDWGRG
jgi:hypothetical protein